MNKQWKQTHADVALSRVEINRSQHLQGLTSCTPLVFHCGNTLSGPFNPFSSFPPSSPFEDPLVVPKWNHRHLAILSEHYTLMASVNRSLPEPIRHLRWHPYGDSQPRSLRSYTFATRDMSTRWDIGPSCSHLSHEVGRLLIPIMHGDQIL